MKKILSFVLACAMLVTPAVSSGCFAGEMVDEPIRGTKSETSQSKSSSPELVAKIMVTTGAIVIAGMGSIFLLDYYSPDGSLARRAGEDAKVAVDTIKAYLNRVGNLTETRCPGLISYLKNTTVAVSNYVVNSKKLINKNMQQFMEFFNNSTNATAEQKG